MQQLHLFDLQPWELWHIRSQAQRRKEQESALTGWELLREQEQNERARRYQLGFTEKETNPYV
jgi:hypothetical protein